MNPPQAHQQRILLLDDEPSVVFALRLLLQALKFEVKEFTSPKEALSYLQSGAKVDWFLCDLRMPELNGAQVQLEAKRSRPDVPFILMSGHATSEEVDAILDAGAVGFLGKPFTPDQLKAVVSSNQSQRAAG